MYATVVDSRDMPVHVANPFGIRESSWVTCTFANAHGVWKPFSITTQDTTAIASADNDGYLIVTGITIAAKKVNNGNIEIHFSDGTNDEEFFNALTSNGEINIDFNWQDQRVFGWKNANLEIITSGANPILTGMIRYLKISDGLTFPEWDALR